MIRKNSHKTKNKEELERKYLSRQNWTLQVDSTRRIG